MEWTEANRTQEDGYTVVWQSKPLGLWKVGVWPVMFGVRVVAWKEGSFGRSVDYCAGDNEEFLATLLFTIKEILSSYPEDVSEVEIEDKMPPWTVRPIYRDPVCWGALRRMCQRVDS